ncbi:hypothetical protein, partial [Streptomyces viridochromogenes]|uniref:hypothetical protein n=1 Tax=Streptomyces viridochromogenes TaxID=1938 RepID=UPI001F2D772D
PVPSPRGLRPFNPVPLGACGPQTPAIGPERASSSNSPKLFEQGPPDGLKLPDRRWGVSRP